MARQELHSETLPKVEQKPPIVDTSAYDGDIVIGEKIGNADYLDELAFMEEPVTIRLEPSSDKNAAGAFPIWVNGKPAELGMRVVAGMLAGGAGGLAGGAGPIDQAAEGIEDARDADVRRDGEHVGRVQRAVRVVDRRHLLILESDRLLTLSICAPLDQHNGRIATEDTAWG